MKHLIFAIVGMPGAGKSEVASLFAGKGLKVVRFGDVTEEELRRRGIPQTADSEKMMREEIRSREGMEAFARRNIPRIDAALERGHVAVDGLYSWAEFLHLREVYGDRFKVIAVIASPVTRYARLCKRAVRPYGPEAAWKRDVAEIERIQKAGPLAMADHSLLNEGLLEELRADFEALWTKLATGPDGGN